VGLERYVQFASRRLAEGRSLLAQVGGAVGRCVRTKPPQIAFDVRYAAPTSFVGAWLTDYRTDDGEKFFDFGPRWKVERTVSGYRLEGMMPWVGRNVTNVEMLDPTHWTAEAEVTDRRNRTLFRNHIDESLVPEGGGTLQHVKFWIEPQTYRAKFMAIFMTGVMRRRFKRGFERMRVLIENEFAEKSRAGSSP
jgi:hypothetical protein